MPLNLDTYPHPQLRYTVRLEYLHPVYNTMEYAFFYLTDEEFEKSYSDKIEQKEEEIREEFGYIEGWEYEITKWGYNYIENQFFKNDILSDNVISLLKTGDITYPAHKDEAERELALAYLNEIKPIYTKEQVAKAILSVIDLKPKVEIVNRILKVWGANLHRDTYVEMQLKMIVNANALDMSLGTMLEVNDPDNLRRLKSKLDLLSSEWNLRQETSAHKRTILLYRFFIDCPIIERNNVSLREGLETISLYLNIPNSTYNKEVQLTEPAKNKEGKYNTGSDSMTNRKVRIYSQINPKWATFKAQYLK